MKSPKLKLLIAGDKTIVKLRPLQVVISKATPYWDDYYCNKCGRHIKAGTLHGRSKDCRHFCLDCCEDIL